MYNVESFLTVDTYFEKYGYCVKQCRLGSVKQTFTGGFKDSQGLTGVLNWLPWEAFHTNMEENSNSIYLIVA